jgi:23S rRNA pseudouridine1911/1915/1917 synthase
MTETSIFQHQQGKAAPGSPVEVDVPAGLSGRRLDVAVALLVPSVSRSAAQRLIADGRVLVDGRRRPQGFALPAGARVSVSLPPPSARPAPAAEPGDLDIVYEDDWVLAIDKRPGLVVHPGAGHCTGTLVHRLLASGRTLSTLGGEDRAGLVHRLDKDTSGIVLIARTDAAHEALARQFADREIRKTYVALVLGPHLPDSGEIRSSFGRKRSDRKQFTGRVTGGREAITGYETLARGRLCALVAARPRTGRTHQIRVHFAEAGHPIVGDRVYGRAYPRPGSVPKSEVEALHLVRRQALHALSLSFVHPGTGDVRTVVASVAADLASAFDVLFGPAWQEAIAGLLARGPRTTADGTPGSSRIR